jgi:V/A-type H+-transporting ATPase subunit D
VPDTRDTVPTRAAVLELKEEHQVVREGYNFLDEKRLLLAAEILRQLKRYQEAMKELQGVHQHAVSAYRDAAAYHGLHGLQVYPTTKLANARVKTTVQSFLGVQLVESKLKYQASDASGKAISPSPEARRCRRSFLELVEHAAVAAGISSNLFRLIAEYRHTERRARALEDVILPEIEVTLGDMETHLEETDQEEAIRARLRYGAQGR